MYLENKTQMIFRLQQTKHCPIVINAAPSHFANKKQLRARQFESHLNNEQKI